VKRSYLLEHLVLDTGYEDVVTVSGSGDGEEKGVFWTVDCEDRGDLKAWSIASTACEGDDSDNDSGPLMEEERADA